MLEFGVTKSQKHSQWNCIRTSRKDEDGGTSWAVRGGDGAAATSGDLNLTFSVFDLRPSFGAWICPEVLVS